MFKIISAVLILSGLSFAQTKEEKPCSTAEGRQFDFWLGDWKADWINKDGSHATGSNHVVSLFNGCAIEENFDGAPGTDLIGKSFSVYVPKEKIWKQTWVDNSGSYLDFEGKFENGKMILSRETIKEQGEVILQRMVYYNIAANEFDWNWEISNDNGKTWKTRWHIHYQRK